MRVRILVPLIALGLILGYQIRDELGPGFLVQDALKTQIDVQGNRVAAYIAAFERHCISRFQNSRKHPILIPDSLENPDFLANEEMIYEDSQLYVRITQRAKFCVVDDLPNLLTTAEKARLHKDLVAHVLERFPELNSPGDRPDGWEFYWSRRAVDQDEQTLWGVIVYQTTRTDGAEFQSTRTFLALPRHKWGWL